MLLINNTKTMVKFYILLAVIVLLLGIGGYFYLNSMKTTESGLNINKIEKIDNVYARSVYSDYFFRIINYGETDKDFWDKLEYKIDSTISKETKEFYTKNTFLRGYYSKLTPLKMSMGYDFSSKTNPQFILKSFDMPSNDEFSKEVGDVDESNFKGYINKIEDFKDVFSMIVATQDQYYFDESYKDTQIIINELLKKDNNITLPKKSIKDYYSTIKTPLKSLKLDHLKLDYFQIKDHLLEEKWQPNIISWVYGNSKITLQYLSQNIESSLDEYISNVSKSKDELILKTLKMDDNEVFTTQYIINDTKHTMTSFIMTNEGGHMYILKMKTDSKSTLLAGMHDFMKINSGLFPTTQVADKWFIKQQKEAIEYLPKFKELLVKINNISGNLGKENPYNRTEFNGVWDQRFELFKETISEYPSKKLFDALTEKYSQLEKEKSDASLFNKAKNTVKGLY